MILACYARAATQAYWPEHCGGHSPEALEAGCVLGQYVVVLRKRGYTRPMLHAFGHMIVAVAVKR